MNIAEATPYLTCVALLLSLCFVCILAAFKAPSLVRYLAYLLFFVVPALTYFDVLSPLTGFDASADHRSFFGISFITPFLALMLYTQLENLKIHPKKLIVVACNPIYLCSGPIPDKIALFVPKTASQFAKNFKLIHRNAIIGMFFLFVVAPGFTKLLGLKSSTSFIDVISFGFIFELYVYFNFAGYSFLAMSLMRLLGFKAPLNFKQPFGSRSVVEYWQRWHISLGNVLRALFFHPIKKRFGTWFAVMSTFFASALWHGVTINFLIWGIFQGAMWTLSRHLYLKKSSTLLQIALLIFSIVIGRIIFSESNPEILFEKLTSVFSTNHQPLALVNVSHTIGLTDSIRITLGMAWIFIEIYLGKKNHRQQRYQFYKQPLVSSALLLLIVIFSGASTTQAVYGAR